MKIKSVRLLALIFCSILSFNSFANKYNDILGELFLYLDGSFSALNQHEKALELALSESYGLSWQLTAQEIAIIKDYSGDSYKIFNQHLHSKEFLPIDHPMNHLALELQQALEDIKDNVHITYRGGSYPFGVYGIGIKKGDIVLNNGFSSTSLSMKVAMDFAKSNNKYNSASLDTVVFGIESRHGKNITSLSSYDNEAEVIIGHDTYFEVKEIGKNPANDVIFVVLSEVDKPTDLVSISKVRNMYTGEKMSCLSL